MILLQISGLAKSVYYYTLSKKDKDEKNKEILEKIKEIFINNKGMVIVELHQNLEIKDIMLTIRKFIE